MEWKKGKNLVLEISVPFYYIMRVYAKVNNKNKTTVCAYQEIADNSVDRFMKSLTLNSVMM